MKRLKSQIIQSFGSNKTKGPKEDSILEFTQGHRKAKYGSNTKLWT